jgi:pimeloyl-ACP methyl ester carboxylesterase
MAEAGVGPSSPVVFNGYSQGGLVAAMLASSGNYNTHGLVTVGAPAGQVELPHGFPVVAIEHADDIVPALGGVRVDPDVLVVQREVFGGTMVPSEFAVPAHQLDQYVGTARLLDEARSDVVVEAAAKLNRFTAGATGAATTWRAERVD